MNVVGATLRYLRHLSTGRTAGIRVGIAGGHFEFLCCVKRFPDCPLESRAQKLIVIVDTVKGDVGLVAACAIDRTGAAVGCASNVRAVAGEGHSRLQAEDAGWVAAFEGEIGDLIRTESVSHGRILGVDQRGSATNLYRHGSACHLHIHVQRGGSGHLEFQAALLHGGETCGVNRHVILGGGQFEELVVALVVGLARAGESRGRVGDHDRCTGNYCAFSVVDRPAQGCSGNLRYDQRTQDKEKSDQQSNYT